MKGKVLRTWLGTDLFYDGVPNTQVVCLPVPSLVQRSPTECDMSV